MPSKGSARTVNPEPKLLDSEVSAVRDRIAGCACQDVSAADPDDPPAVGTPRASAPRTLRPYA
jgi:hypothetical protein